jgi:hypothetical protein
MASLRVQGAYHVVLLAMNEAERAPLKYLGNAAIFGGL